MIKKLFLILFYLFSFLSFSNEEDIEKLNINVGKAFENIEVIKELLTQVIKSENVQVNEINEIKKRILDLEKKFENLGDSKEVKNINKEKIINLKNKKIIIDNFRFKNYGLSLDNENKLLKFFQEIDFNDVSHIKIKGYSDSQGAKWYNESISFLRAKEVYKFIIKNFKVDTQIIEYNGYLNEDIDTSNLKNRRVEIEIFFHEE